ncbi:MAG: hypothetical protein OQK79_12340 [Rhodanobacter sp.]|nr:hypothetical protein [Rhodanobacter sp.]
MTGSLATLFVACLLSMTLGISPARARSGRILFSGAVVAPTCTISDARNVAPVANSSSQRLASGQFVCLDANGSADEARSYARTEVRLDANSTVGNRLLGYFVDHDSGANIGVVEAVLVTRNFR